MCGVRVLRLIPTREDTNYNCSRCVRKVIHGNGEEDREVLEIIVIGPTKIYTNILHSCHVSVCSYFSIKKKSRNVMPDSKYTALDLAFSGCSI